MQLSQSSNVLVADHSYAWFLSHLGFYKRMVPPETIDYSSERTTLTKFRTRSPAKF